MDKVDIRATSLSLDERDWFVRLATEGAFGEETRKLTLQYYLQYRNYLREQNRYRTLKGEQLVTVLTCCFFLGSQSESWATKDQAKHRVADGMSKLIGSSKNVDLLMYSFKQVIKCLNLDDTPYLSTAISSLTTKFGFSLTFRNKFDRVIKHLDLYQPTRSSLNNYLKTVSNFCWLLFIDCAQRLGFNSAPEVVETVCLLARVVLFVSNEAPHFVKSSKIGQVIGQIMGSKRYSELCTQYIMDLFKVRDKTVFESVGLKFVGYVNSSAGRCGVTEASEIVNPARITNSYKQVNQAYQQLILNSGNIDLRLFIKDRTLLTPSKFTPFGGQLVVSVNKNRQVLNSRRILQYELEEPPLKPGVIFENSGLQKRQKLFAPAINVRIPSNITSTPMTQAMQMYNWIVEKPKRQKGINRYQKLIERVIDLQKRQPDKKSRQNRKWLIWNLFSDICSHCGTEQIALLVWSVQTVYSILNFKEVTIGKTIEVLGSNWLDVWRLADHYLRYDSTMPVVLKCHILELQTRILSFQLWTYHSELVSVFQRDSDITSRENFLESSRLRNRVQHQIAFQVYILSQALGFDQQSVTLIYNSMLHLLNNHSTLLVCRHLDQLILCCFYSISKVLGLNLKFNEIISKYKSATKAQKGEYYEITQQVKVGEKKGDIICFYNTVFINLMRSYLQKQRSQHKFQPRQREKIQTDNSQLEDIIGKQIFDKGNRSNRQNQFLLAYDHSPLLRTQSVSHVPIYLPRSPNFEEVSSAKLLELPKKTTTQRNPISPTYSKNHHSPKEPTLKKVLSSRQLFGLSPKSKQPTTQRQFKFLGGKR